MEIKKHIIILQKLKKCYANDIARFLIGCCLCLVYDSLYPLLLSLSSCSSRSQLNHFVIVKFNKTLFTPKTTYVVIREVRRRTVRRLKVHSRCRLVLLVLLLLLLLMKATVH